MYPYIHIILPSYGLMAFIGGFFALLVTFFRIHRFSIEFLDFLTLLPLCVLGGMIGSKALFVISRIPWLIQNFSIENGIHLIVHSGFVFYGGLFGVLLAVALYARYTHKYSADKLFRLIAPAIPLFHCFGRIGCFLAGCCYGCTLLQPILLGELQIDRFPAQVSEAVFEAILFAAMLIVDKQKKDSNLLRMYLVLYAVFRFIIEFFRGDEIRGIFGGLSTAQWISMGIVLYYMLKFLCLPRSSGHSAADTNIL